VKHRRAHVLPLFALAALCTCVIAPACGGPRLTTLAPGVYAEAGEGGTANAGQPGATPRPEAGAAGLTANVEAGSGGVPAEGGSRG